MFKPECSKVIGNICPPTYDLNHTIEKGYYYKEEEKHIEREGNPRYLTIRANLIYEEDEARY